MSGFVLRKGGSQLRIGGPRRAKYSLPIKRGDLKPNHASYPIHTRKLLGTNNKTKALKRQSYDFHDLEYFSFKIKQQC